MQNDTSLYEIPADRMAYTHEKPMANRELGKAEVVSTFRGKAKVRTIHKDKPNLTWLWGSLGIIVATAIAWGMLSKSEPESSAPQLTATPQNTASAAPSANAVSQSPLPEAVPMHVPAPSASIIVNASGPAPVAAPKVEAAKPRAPTEIHQTPAKPQAPTAKLNAGASPSYPGSASPQVQPQPLASTAKNVTAPPADQPPSRAKLANTQPRQTENAGAPGLSPTTSSSVATPASADTPVIPAVKAESEKNDTTDHRP